MRKLNWATSTLFRATKAQRLPSPTRISSRLISSSSSSRDGPTASALFTSILSHRPHHLRLSAHSFAVRLPVVRLVVHRSTTSDSSSSSSSATLDAASLTPESAREFLSKLDAERRSVVLRELTVLLEEGSSDAPTPPAGVAALDPPSGAQLRLVCLHNCLPFIGFGFLDNALMILAGDYIDTTIGVALGISTMAAAGLGNLLSDLAGLGTAHYIEHFCLSLGMRSPDLSFVQKEMRITRFFVNLGRAIGITIGCLLGMFSLFFTKGREELEKDMEKDMEKELEIEKKLVMEEEEVKTNEKNVVSPKKETPVPSSRDK